MEKSISKKPLYLTLKFIQKFKEKNRIKKKNINLKNSVIIFHGLSLVSNVIIHIAKRIADILVKIMLGCEGYSFSNIKANMQNKVPVKKHDRFILRNKLFSVPNIFLITFLIFSFILFCPLHCVYLK